MVEPISEVGLSALLVSVGRGDCDALQQVYQLTSGRLFALCLRVTGNRSAAEDVLQEAFIKIWNRAPAFDPELKTSWSWLSTITRNSAIDWYRAHHRRQFVGDYAISSIEDEAEPVLDRIIREERENRAAALLQDLPPEQRDEIQSIFYMGLTYSELAAREGVPVATLKSRIRRAVLAVRKNFDHE